MPRNGTVHSAILKNNPQATQLENQNGSENNLIAFFTVDVKLRSGNSPIIKYDSATNTISSFKARFMFEDYQTFYAKDTLYAFKNGDDFHAIMIEDAASMS